MNPNKKPLPDALINCCRLTLSPSVCACVRVRERERERERERGEEGERERERGGVLTKQNRANYRSFCSKI